MGYKRKAEKQVGLNYLLLLLLLLLIFLCGCEKQKDSIKNDMQSLEGTDASASGEAVKEKSSRLKEQLHIPEELQMDVLGNDGKRGYQVNCEVDVPIETSPAVYQQRRRPFTKEEIKKKAEKLFDSGEFTYVKPYDCYAMEELNEEYKKVEKEYTEERDFFWHQRTDIELYIELYEEPKPYEEGEFIEGAKASVYDKIIIIEGKIGGEEYHLLAFSSKGHDYLKLCRPDCYALTDMRSYFGYSYKLNVGDEILEQLGISDSDNSDINADKSLSERYLTNEVGVTEQVRKEYGENMCSYSEEEAGKLALQYVTLFADADMTIVKTNWGTETPFINISQTQIDKYTGANSYVFYLQRQYGGLTCNESNFWWREATDADEKAAREVDSSGIVTEQELYRILVCDEGVVSVDTIEPWYEIEKTLSESTSLMDFHDIEELAKGYFTEAVQGMKTDKYSEKNITRIGEVAIRYATVLYNGEYTLIPCWFFNQSDDMGMSTVMVINAIDGSKVFLSGME